MGTIKMLQRERVKRYFLDAAKDLVRSEGMAGLTTKKIGDRAGFSYATIYNYFSNFNELLCLCTEELAEECREYVAGRMDELPPLSPDTKIDGSIALIVKERLLAFADFMVDYNGRNPNVYFPFLSTDLDFSFFKARDGRAFVHPAYPLLVKELEAGASALGLASDGITHMADVLTYVFHAKLHFFIRYGVPESLEVLRDEVRRETQFLLGR